MTGRSNLERVGYFDENFVQGLLERTNFKPAHRSFFQDHGSVAQIVVARIAMKLWLLPEEESTAMVFQRKVFDYKRDDFFSLSFNANPESSQDRSFINRMVGELVSVEQRVKPVIPLVLDALTRKGVPRHE